MLIHGGTIRKGFLYWSGRGRVVLDELEQFVLEDYLARRRGDVLAHFEGRGVGHADAQLAVAGLDVVQQVVEALDQVLAVALDGFAEDFRIGQGEVGRRQRVDVLTGEEVDLLLGRFVQAFGAGSRYRAGGGR